MPDLVLQLALLLVLGGLVALFVAIPLVRRSPDGATGDRETLELRHRVAIEALRDVEADRRAGSLDDETYAAQRGEAESRAAQTLAELDSASAPVDEPVPAGRGWRPAAIAGAVLAVLLVGGFLVGPPIGLANQTIDTRQQAIDSALERLQANPRDAQAFSDLANAYIAGDSYADMQRGAAALIGLIALEPDNTSAYQRLVSTYIRVQDWKDASAATDSYAKLATDSPDVPFFRGLIARGQGDSTEARRQFQAFLDAAPDDPRAAMVRALLDGS
jgi:cytochrome c-type biogenesis protein CcmI